MKFHLEVDLSDHRALWQKLAVMAYYLATVAKLVLSDDQRGTIEDATGNVIGRWRIEHN